VGPAFHLEEDQGVVGPETAAGAWEEEVHGSWEVVDLDPLEVVDLDSSEVAPFDPWEVGDLDSCLADQGGQVDQEAQEDLVACLVDP